MIPITDESMRSKFDKQFEVVKKTELCEENFGSIYFKPTGNHFRVAASKSDVIGRVVLKRLNADGVELERMSVDGGVRKKRNRYEAGFKID